MIGKSAPITAMAGPHVFDVATLVSPLLRERDGRSQMLTEYSVRWYPIPVMLILYMVPQNASNMLNNANMASDCSGVMR